MSRNNNICIDFGTSNSVVSYIPKDSNIIYQIADEMTGDILIPTTIYFDDLYEGIIVDNMVYGTHFHIGHIANDMFNTSKASQYYFYQFKRFLGVNNNTIQSCKDFLDKHNIDYIADSDIINFYIPIGHSKLKISIIELIKLFFKALKFLICDKLNLDINMTIDIILTCPAYFHDLQRSQLERAVKGANFTIFKLYNEPTAATIYYINKTPNLDIENNKLIIYDLGGGTIDTTVVEYSSTDNICEVIDIDGNNTLGGIDIDILLCNDIYNKYHIDKTNTKWYYRIKKCAEDIKIKLSYTELYTAYLDNIPIKKHNIISIIDTLKISYTRQEFNNIINKLIDEMIQPIKFMYNKYNTNNIIFIGGPTQIPLLQDKVKNMLAIININTDSQKNLYKTIVSQGGSYMFKLLNNKCDFTLLDIIPMNIGIASPDNIMINMITKNSKIPCKIERYFTTSHDCQRTIDIEVYEGIDTLCSNNTLIGTYKIIGIPALKRGDILIKLFFEITSNGILKISIDSFKNPYNDDVVAYDFKLYKEIRLISASLTKDLLKKLLLK